MKKRYSTKGIISVILSFILMLAIIATSIMVMGKYSMLSVRAVMHTCDRIGYYEKINEEMVTLAYEKGIPFGIKKKYIKNVFDDDQIKKDMGEVLKAQVNEEEYLVDTEDIRKKITDNVIEGEGKLNASEQESLNAYLVEISNMYKDKMIIAGSSYFTPLIPFWTKVLTIGIPLCLLTMALCIFAMITMRRRTYKGLRYVSYSILGAGATLTTVFAASISNGFVYKFNISDVYMRKFYTFWIGHEMLMQVFVGIGLLIAGAVLVYIIYRQKYKYGK